MYTLRVEGAFEAAHRIVDYPGKCNRLHGHNWVVEATVQGTVLDKLGMLIDFKVLKKAFNEVLDRYDHRFLNEIEPFAAGENPTAENIAREVYREFAQSDCFHKADCDAHLAAIRVFESPKSSVTYTEDK